MRTGSRHRAAKPSVNRCTDGELLVCGAHMAATCSACCPRAAGQRSSERSAKRIRYRNRTGYDPHGYSAGTCGQYQWYGHYSGVHIRLLPMCLYPCRPWFLLRLARHGRAARVIRFEKFENCSALGTDLLRYPLIRFRTQSLTKPTHGFPLSLSRRSVQTHELSAVDLAIYFVQSCTARPLADPPWGWRLRSAAKSASIVNGGGVPYPWSIRPPSGFASGPDCRASHTWRSSSS